MSLRFLCLVPLLCLPLCFTGCSDDPEVVLPDPIPGEPEMMGAPGQMTEEEPGGAVR